jgi:hypothetical protein
MLLEPGNKILVAHRRLFERDLVRFFLGRVDAYEEGVVKATGRTYVRDPMGGRMIEKADARTKLLSLSSGTLIVYQLPEAVELEGLKFIGSDGLLALTDERGFAMDLTEVAHAGRV